MEALRLRPIERQDDPGVAALIRTVMPEFGAGGPGFAINDPEVDHMWAAYSTVRLSQMPTSAYFVIEIVEEHQILGGGGFGPLAGGPKDTCELRKMYFLPQLRGRGWGRRLLERCLELARAQEFKRCYLETLTGMNRAQALYEKAGFLRIGQPMGATGHCGCDRWYLKTL